MIRTLLVLAIFCLLVTTSLSAQVRDLKGQSWVSGNLGYAFGTGDAFTSYTEPITSTKFSSSAGIGFGGQYYYGVKPKLLIGGELMFQSYSVEMSMPANLALGIQETESSESRTETNVIVNTMYSVSQTRNSDLFLMGGPGLYDFDGMQLGMNTGLFWRHQVSPTVHLFGMPRMHIVLTDNTPIMFQFTMGAQFSI